MNERLLQEAFSSLPLGGLRYFDSIGSTNNEASTWVSQGAFDLSLIVANEQTAGRGRSKRRWFTPSDSALAFSLILRPTAAELTYPARITGLGALALVDSLRAFGLLPKIKWPNDVLINGRKIAGILVETVWSDDALVASVLGMGVNVLNASTPPAEEMLYPATSIEMELERPLERANLLKAILLSLLKWRNKLGENEFMLAWGEALAFHGEQVQIMDDQRKLLTGELKGLEPDGSLIIRTPDGKLQGIQFGEIHLRPAL